MSSATICFQDTEFLTREGGLTTQNILDYFYRSPFYEAHGGLNSVNELYSRSRTNMTFTAFSNSVEGTIFLLTDCNKHASADAPSPLATFVIQRFLQKRDPKTLDLVREPQELFYCVGGSIYQAPCLGEYLSNRLTLTLNGLESMLSELGRGMSDVSSGHVIK